MSSRRHISRATPARARLHGRAALPLLAALLLPLPAGAQRAATPDVPPPLAAPRVSPSGPPPGPSPGPFGEREVTLANRSGLAISEIYISPTSADGWGDDRLGEAVLESGRTLRLRLGRMRDCAFDLLVIYDDASREERPAQNLCRNRQVAFDGKARIRPAVASPPERQVVLANQSSRAIQQVFVSPADAPDWGQDVLPRAISAGEHGTVAWRGPCTVDIRVVFENRAAEERRGVDLCRRATFSVEPGWTTSDELPTPPA